MSPKMNVLTVGNAIVDIFARCEDEFLNSQEIGKGMMNLVDAARSAKLYAALESPREISGGSAANTAVGIVALGGTAGFAGRVHDDALGDGFFGFGRGDVVNGVAAFSGQQGVKPLFKFGVHVEHFLQVGRQRHAVFAVVWGEVNADPIPQLQFELLHFGFAENDEPRSFSRG